MTNREYRELIAAVGLNQVEAANFFDVSDRTSRNYAANGAPSAVTMLLHVMVKYGITVADIEKLKRKRIARV